MFLYFKRRSKLIRYEHKIPVEDYQRLREHVGWCRLSPHIADMAVGNSFYSQCVYDDDKVIGMMRVSWQGDDCALITDVVVDENYRSRGIGKTMVLDSIEKIKSYLEKGDEIKVLVISAPGRESFYEHLGFRRRPNKLSGSTLDMWITK